jgi:hypothetical protein
LATILVAFLSEFLVGSIETARQSLGLTETFVGVIVLALVGNAAEHTTAVWAALKNKMDLSLSIALGSSMQVALFVTPVLVFASYMFDRPMDLEFSLPEIVAIAIAIWIAQQISGDGESNWLRRPAPFGPRYRSNPLFLSPRGGAQMVAPAFCNKLSRGLALARTSQIMKPMLCQTLLVSARSPIDYCDGGTK